jgi:hypothetical protein
MLKIGALLFNSIALLLYQLFFSDTVTITPTIPSSAKVGTEFTVEMIIDKGSTSGFAKFQQDLPAGFTAMEGESDGGAFTFINQSVKILWMTLPSASSLKITYKVKVSANALGTHNLTGKFAYSSDNVGQTVELPPTAIVIDDGTSPPDDALTQKTAAPSEPVQPVTTVNCSRKLPDNILSDSEFLVDVIVNKGDLTGFAKLVETLPQGFTAMEVESEGAIFSFEEQKVSYVWSSMPTQQEFKISYRVKIDPSVEGEKLIEGVFSFIQNDQTNTYSIAPGTVKVVASKPSEPIAVSKKAAVKPSVAKSKALKDMSANSIPAAQSDGKMHYKVQILALKRVKSIEKIATHFKLAEPISLEMAEGFTKYTVGSYDEYSLAHDARDNYTNQNNIKGSFVTAYNGGKRITIQEALMITNQKWYK